MSSEARRADPAEAAATGLRLGELIAIQPRNIRGRLAPGQRLPGGQRPGRGRAQSLDFDGISPYQPGDDVRWIEWRASLRTGQTQMRRFAAESHRARMIVLDLRPDLYFGASERLMAKTAALVAAWLGWESLALQEPVGLVVAGAQPIQPRRGRRHLLGLLDVIVAAYRAEPQPAALDAAIERASAALGRGDEICVVSDLPASPEGLAAIGRRLARLRAVRLYVVEDQAFAAPMPAGRYPVRGPDGRRHAPLLRADADRAALAADLALRRRALRDGGWALVDALDILPRARRTAA